jgi:hypothetical protein
MLWFIACAWVTVDAAPSLVQLKKQQDLNDGLDDII